MIPTNTPVLPVLTVSRSTAAGITAALKQFHFTSFAKNHEHVFRFPELVSKNAKLRKTVIPASIFSGTNIHDVN